MNIKVNPDQQKNWSYKRKIAEADLWDMNANSCFTQMKVSAHKVPAELNGSHALEEAVRS